jgi:L-seryl-tRNA(Ser) seleniumtransferase
MCMENNLRKLPSVDKLLDHPAVKSAAGHLPHELLVSLIRENLQHYRTMILNGKDAPSTREIADNVLNQAEALTNLKLKKVINATGVVLHTNLGRSPLSEDTIKAMQAASRGYNNLEFDLGTGTRGSRNIHVESFLQAVTGAEAGLVVNNNASAVMLGLTALARRKEVIVSRGQAVEIGGAFRIPEVMSQSGAKLIEVGTTNCTYIHDYENAVTQRTAALLRVHSSNFQVIGFTQSVELNEMVDLGRKLNIPVFDDLGSGCPLNTEQFGMAHEPTIRESIEAGVDLAFFSGDKLMGGPQAGIIVGKKVYIDKIKKHPLMRALRVDKTRLAGVAATLIHYIKGEALTEIPIWRMISMPLKDINKRAEHWAESIGSEVMVIDGESLIGGGSLPGTTLPSKLLALGSSSKPAAARNTAQRLRTLRVPIVARISDDVLLLDPRTVAPEDDEKVIESLKEVTARH